MPAMAAVKCLSDGLGKGSAISILGIIFGIINNPFNNRTKVCPFGSQSLKHFERNKNLQKILHTGGSLSRNLAYWTTKLTLG